MKKTITFLASCASILFVASLCSFEPAKAYAAGVPVETLYVSATGNDENAGTENAPFQTLDKALTEIDNGGVISLQGTIAIDAWKAHGKTATITGGTLDVTAMSTNVQIGDAVTFTNMGWKIASGSTASVYANGYEVTMGENVSWDHEVTLFGGGNGTTVESTNLTVLSGSYVTIYGGTREGCVTGDTNLYVGGNVNNELCSDHKEYQHGLVYAGGYDKGITGCANVTFGENANARYIYGGQYYSSNQTGGANVTITGGTVMSVYGGSKGATLNCSANVLITGGKIEQVFGGCEEGAVNGDVTVRALGGEITRRIYGGCYNNYKLLEGWVSSHKVSGKITVELGGTANISLRDSQSDKGIFAFSRYGSELETDTQIVFTSEAAYNAYKNKLGDDYSGASWDLSGAKEYHYYTYTASGNVLTQSCAYHSDHVATAEIIANVGTYTGEKVQDAKLEVSATWAYTQPTISYENNVEVGEATAYVGVGEVKAEQSFIIIEAPEVLGGSVRLTDPSGLRFQSKVSSALVGLEGVSFGTLVIPKAVLGDAELTVETPSVKNILQTKWATEIVKIESPERYEEGYEYFNAVLKDIPEAHYDKEIVARSYVCINGQYYYAQEQERSIMQVASYAIRDGGTADMLFTYVNKGMAGKDFSITGTTSLMEGLNGKLQVVSEQNCVAVWSSSNTKVVEVDKFGNIIAKREGTATITAKIGNVVRTIEITVTSGWTGIW